MFRNISMQFWITIKYLIHKTFLIVTSWKLFWLKTKSFSLICYVWRRRELRDQADRFVAPKFCHFSTRIFQWISSRSFQKDSVTFMSQSRMNNLKHKQLLFLKHAQLAWKSSRRKWRGRTKPVCIGHSSQFLDFTWLVFRIIYLFLVQVERFFACFSSTLLLCRYTEAAFASTPFIAVSLLTGMNVSYSQGFLNSALFSLNSSYFDDQPMFLLEENSTVILGFWK